MAMEEPLLSPPTASSSADNITASSTPTAPIILARLAAILTLLAIALWANYEAAKGVDISVVNSAAGTHAGRRFHLMFVSNGRAYRITHRASQFVERALYPDDDEGYPRKPITHITLHLAGSELASTTSVSPRGAGPGDYAIHVSPALMYAADADAAFAAAVHRAVARLWLWDGQRTAPEPLLEAVAEYLAVTAGYGSSFSNPYPTSLEDDGSCDWSADFLRHCEARRSGLIARLNKGMRERWSELAVEDALGSPVRQACAAYKTRAAAAAAAD